MLIKDKKCRNASIFVVFHGQRTDIFLVPAEVKAKVTPTYRSLAPRAVPADLVRDLGGIGGQRQALVLPEVPWAAYGQWAAPPSQVRLTRCNKEQRRVIRAGWALGRSFSPWIIGVREGS